jgi:G3E family GTPase
MKTFRLLFLALVSFALEVPMAISFSASASASPSGITTPTSGIIPVTIISGFLGTGKSTLLQHLLHNKEGRRIAVIVNDVATVNIDSKLVSSTNEASGIVQLQNGCACCSLSDELLSSVEELVTMSDIRGENEGFQHIVVELSGVADPKGIRSKFQEAIMYDMPVMKRVQLDTMVTVVDCSAFLQHLTSSKFVNPNDAPELFFPNGEAPEQKEDWMEGMPQGLIEALQAGGFYTLETTNSGVADLMVSQTETADVVLLNKEDLSDNETVERIQQIVLALNPRACVIRTEYGKVPIDAVLGAAKGMGVAMAGVVDDHKDSVQAATVVIDRSLAEGDCNDPDCTDPNHAHSHSHDHACNDPECTDKSHLHSHSHSHVTTLLDTGIGSFVYRARRPFHPKRLVAFLNQMPMQRGVPEESEGAAIQFSESTKEILQNVIRSKGFAWCADSDKKALYWSHAGASFDMQCLGAWWATLPRNQWPPEAVETVLEDFDNENHVDGDNSIDSVGDRRQEIVFIGPRLGDSNLQAEICENLDRCLVNDSEWEVYKNTRGNEQALEAAFTNRLVARTVSY